MKQGLTTLDGKYRVYVTVDGTDFRICEPTCFDPKWMSHKFKSAGIRYEIGVSVSSGSIVWLHGPFPAGEQNDQGIFNLKMRQHLQQHEKVLCDAGYSGSHVTNGSLYGDTDDKLASNLRAYHERLNGKIKSFGSMTHRWRHQLEKHQVCFFAVAHIVQIAIEDSE